MSIITKQFTIYLLCCKLKQKETIKVYVKFYHAENKTEKRVGGAEPAEEVLGAASQGTGETAQGSGETP